MSSSAKFAHRKIIEASDVDDKQDTRKQQESQLHTNCPYCLSGLDVHLDVKGRPYWRCWRCEVRSFATRSAQRSFEANGWIWTKERPLKELEEWLGRLAKKAGLPKRLWR